ncbi:MAG TPA: DUF5330 domain-containing protein [Pseudolabrys sp.]|nr:DUF5330 domain-containing protein [Pseudolabrys sp.]
MFFLLRMAFWLGLVCVLLPGSGSKSADSQIDADQAITLASAAVSDARGFCDRQPDACKVGGKVAVALGYKAEAGARTLYDFVMAKLNDKSASAKPDKTGAKTAPKAEPISNVDRGTLKASDLSPAWHGRVPLPPVRREARAGRPSA